MTTYIQCKDCEKWVEFDDVNYFARLGQICEDCSQKRLKKQEERNEKM
jgi:DNA-directed RNA polymerase subunit RPC12/RpoP